MITLTGIDTVDSIEVRKGCVPNTIYVTIREKAAWFEGGMYTNAGMHLDAKNIDILITALTNLRKELNDATDK